MRPGPWACRRLRQEGTRPPGLLEHRPKTLTVTVDGVEHVKVSPRHRYTHVVVVASAPDRWCVGEATALRHARAARRRAKGAVVYVAVIPAGDS